MQQVTFDYSPTRNQQLFVEKVLECLYIGTLDSYRLRLHNPKSIIEELIHVAHQVKNNILQRNEYVTEVSKEALTLLDSDNHALRFTSISLEYYRKLLQNANKKASYSRIIQASRLVIKDNIEYSLTLLHELEKLLIAADKEDDYDEQTKLLSFTEYSIIELVNLGYTKQYLYNYIRTIMVFAGGATWSFTNRFGEFKKLFFREPEEYTVIFKIDSDQFQFRELYRIDNEYIQITKRFRAIAKLSVSRQVSQYLEDNKHGKLVGLAVQSLDHYKAIDIARERLSKDLDLYHLGFSGIRNSIDKQAAVIGKSNPDKASTAPSNYQLEGFTRGNEEIFNLMLDKVNKMKTNNVSGESIEKIYAGFRYLRMGSEANELETKLLNYWIGLEFAFTSFVVENKTIDRIRTFYPVCHALIYVRRNLFDFHKALSRLNVSLGEIEVTDDLTYLSNFHTYDKIVANSQSILMQCRARQIQTWISNPANLERKLHSHIENIKWNISRLYRTRNEVVHNAATKSNITANVSHLKYYLTFILNSMLEFLAESPVDTDDDGSITIEDYLIAQDIIYGSMKKEKVLDYLKVNNPIEVLF